MSREIVAAPQILWARVMHRRTFPAQNAFTYRVYYLVLPLDKLDAVEGVALDRFGPVSLRRRDHGDRTGAELEPWIRARLADAGIGGIASIALVTLPRIFGYGFNPVSFWLCLDRDGALRAVLSEVSNTFGETHSYLCAHDDGRPIEAGDWLGAGKRFHVSPFLKREGSYTFRFALKGDHLGIWIDYRDASGARELLTAMTGRMEPLTRTSMRRAFWRHPHVAAKTIGLIHWQALKLALKRVRYRRKPPQLAQRISLPEYKTAKSGPAALEQETKEITRCGDAR